MKKYIIWSIIILVALALLNPLCRPVNHIRAYVLLRVPLGTSITKAEEKIYYWTTWEIGLIKTADVYAIQLGDTEKQVIEKAAKPDLAMMFFAI